MRPDIAISFGAYLVHMPQLTISPAVSLSPYAACHLQHPYLLCHMHMHKVCCICIQSAAPISAGLRPDVGLAS